MRNWFATLGVFGKGFAGSALAVILILLLIHFYVDHLAFHEVVNMINANAKQQTQQQVKP